MRQTRSKVRRESTGKKFTFVIVIIMLFSISIFLGYLGTKYILLPILSPNKIEVKKDIHTETVKEVSKEVIEEVKKKKETEATDETTKEAYVNTFEIEGFDIYSVQVGSFTTNENAQALVKELNTKEMSAYVWYNDGYKVLSNSMLDREGIELAMPSIKQKYKEAFVVTKNIPTRAIKYTKEDSSYIDMLESQRKKVVEVFGKLSEIVKQSENSQIDIKECSVLTKKYVEDLKEIQGQLKKENPSKHMKPIHNQFVKLVDDFTQELETAMKDDTKLLLGIKNALTKVLHQYSDFAEKNEY